MIMLVRVTCTSIRILSVHRSIALTGLRMWQSPTQWPPLTSRIARGYNERQLCMWDCEYDRPQWMQSFYLKSCIIFYSLYHTTETEK